jgi:transposase
MLPARTEQRSVTEVAMAYREVTMIEAKEVLRLWMSGMGNKRIARWLDLDPKTVRRYIGAAQEHGIRIEGGAESLTDEIVGAVLAQRRGAAHRPRGESWQRCEEQRDFIKRYLDDGVRLSKVRKLLRRHGVCVPYPTLHRFAVSVLGFGGRGPTIPLCDGEPGQECQVDTGWVVRLEPDEQGKRRRRKAWIFTAVVSRHRFVYPIERETTESAIEACEAAWEFFGGIFRVLLPDNTKAIVQHADPLEPVINAAFLEYAQARGFHIDPTRVRKPRDKARVERSVAVVRDDCFAGERLLTLEVARTHARQWCLEECGMRRHSTTQRLPREHFESEEHARLLPAPTAAYDIPVYGEPKVGRDQHAQLAKALYSLPGEFVGKRLHARADRYTVRFYDRGRVVKVHPRMPAGKRSTDAADFPEHKRAYAMRDIVFLQQQATAQGERIGRMATIILAVPLPWTRMRRVYALLGLVKKYGAERVEPVCRIALEAEMYSVPRLKRMLEQPCRQALPAPRAPCPPPPARYLRPAKQFALPLSFPLVEVSHGQ